MQYAVIETGLPQMFTDLIAYRAAHKWTIGYSDAVVLAHMAKLEKGWKRRFRKMVRGK